MVIFPKHVFPVSVEIDVASTCTRKCWFCNPGIPKHRRENPVFFSQQYHKNIVDDLALNFDYNENHWLTYCGMGEPLMNPNLGEMLRYARKILPFVSMNLLTNGDLLTEDFCRICEETGTYLIWDYYEDDDTSRRVPQIIKASGMDLKLAKINDQTRRTPSTYISRCSTLWPVGYLDAPCLQPSGSLFFAAEGYPVICCNDYHHTVRFVEGMLPSEFRDDKVFKTLCHNLKFGNRKICEACSKCEIVSCGNNEVIKAKSNIIALPSIASHPIFHKLI